MNSKIDQNNLAIYLSDESEKKSLRRIENSLGKSIKIKDLKSLEISTQVESLRSVGRKSMHLIHKYMNNDNLNVLINSRKDLIKASDLNENEIEKNIIQNIEFFHNELNNREKFIFDKYYGYKTEVLTLEKTAEELFKIEKTKKVTRERIRQLINIIKKKLTIKPFFDLKNLEEFLKKNQSQSFHKIFPNLDKIFTDTVQFRQKDISGDRLTQFLSDLTGKEYGYYKTPEILIKSEFDVEQLNEIFGELPYGVNEDIFASEIKTIFGFDDTVTKNAIQFMDENKLITHKNNKIYPLKLNSKDEISHICLKFPKGIFWKDIYEILNNSPSKNNFNLNRILADHKILENDDLWLCAKGTHKHYTYLRYKENKDEIIQAVLNVLSKKKQKTLKLIEVFNSINSNKLLRNNLEYFELRAFIKYFGKQKGIFWQGRSNVDTISLNKNFSYIKNKDNILKIINRSSEAIHEKKIIKLIDKGTNISSIISLHGEQLIKEKKVMRVGPKLWFNYDKALNLCNIDLFREESLKLFKLYETISLHYITNYLNKKLNLALSYYYYDSLFSSMSRELNLFFHNTYISKKDKKFTSEKIYRDYFENDLNLAENIKKIASDYKIAVSYEQFINAKYIYA